MYVIASVMDGSTNPVYSCSNIVAISCVAGFLKLKNFDMYLTMKVPEAAINQLVRQLENSKIINISAANNVRRCNKLFEKWNKLLDVLAMSEEDSYQAFFDSLRILNQDNLARILEEGEGECKSSF